MFEICQKYCVEFDPEKRKNLIQGKIKCFYDAFILLHHPTMTNISSLTNSCVKKITFALLESKHGGNKDYIEELRNNLQSIKKKVEGKCHIRYSQDYLKNAGELFYNVHSPSSENFLSSQEVERIRNYSAHEIISFFISQEPPKEQKKTKKRKNSTDVFAADEFQAKSPRLNSNSPTTILHSFTNNNNNNNNNNDIHSFYSGNDNSNESIGEESEHNGNIQGLAELNPPPNECFLNFTHSIHLPEIQQIEQENYQNDIDSFQFDMDSITMDDEQVQVHAHEFEHEISIELVNGFATEFTQEVVTEFTEEVIQEVIQEEDFMDIILPDYEFQNLLNEP